MTSLLSYASPWQTGEQRNTRKRTPTMSDDSRKTRKTDPSGVESETDDLTDTTDLQYQNTRAAHVHNMLNKMNSVHVDNEGSPLENFSIPEKVEFSPSTGVKSENSFSKSSMIIADNTRRYMENQNPEFVKYASSLGNSFSSYPQSYPKKETVSAESNKVTEKMNYIIYLLEQQQHEETNNITEEFILYTLLGVFVIYVIDSFSRTGKYIR